MVPKVFTSLTGSGRSNTSWDYNATKEGGSSTVYE